METAGGSLLILIGLLIAGAYPKVMARNFQTPAILSTIVTLALSPLLAGILFLVHSRGKQRYA